MKKIILLLLIVFLEIAESQAQGWEWMKPVGFDYTWSTESSLTKSTNGNLLIKCKSDVSTSVRTDLILCSPNGDTLWKKSFPNLVIEDLSFDQFDNIYFAGNFKDTIVLGGTAYNTNGIKDAIIGKLDMNGNYVSHVSFGSDIYDSANSLVFNDNKLFVTGTFQRSFNFGGVTFNTSGVQKAYVMKLDTSFNLLKSIQTDSTGEAEGIKINADKSGKVYLLFKGDSYVRLGATTLYIADYGQFLAKFSNDLELDWANVIIFHSTNGMYLRHILFDKLQHIIMVKIGGGGGGSLHYHIVQKFDSLGSPVSSKAMPINRLSYIDVDTADNVWMAGMEEIYVPPVYFTICKLSPLNVTDTIFHDAMIKHTIKGFVVNYENDFYVFGKNFAGSYLGPFSCPDDGVGFLAHYGQGLVTQVHPLASSENFKIYPNPSGGIFTLELSEELKQSVHTICVYDILGRCILTQPYSNETDQQIDISGAGKGIYFVEVETEKERINKKIVLN